MSDGYWVEFTRRTNSPKLDYLQVQLRKAGIDYKMQGASAHAPIMWVPKTELERANAILEEEIEHGVTLDDILDDDPMFDDYFGDDVDDDDWPDDPEPDYPDPYDDDYPIDGVGFADPGGRSALRAATPDNPRDQPCPQCGAKNVLTRIDVARHYVCDRCADRNEGRMGGDY